MLQKKKKKNVVQTHNTTESHTASRRSTADNRYYTLHGRPKSGGLQRFEMVQVFEVDYSSVVLGKKIKMH